MLVTVITKFDASGKTSVTLYKGSLTEEERASYVRGLDFGMSPPLNKGDTFHFAEVFVSFFGAIPSFTATDANGMVKPFC